MGNIVTEMIVWKSDDGGDNYKIVQPCDVPDDLQGEEPIRMMATGHTVQLPNDEAIYMATIEREPGTEDSAPRIIIPNG